ncbi:putative metallo-beta-lactamase family protein [Patulibacter medicamentivorans]|uniref:Putative metallo-beta-lactamase family protein n=1 Tax=Patulibacter medicamentivorans TaxID=1097667 RepID=H0E8D9_9ACTN|nr:MBL fold metallo-hydrolase [Patulibacter medicamentivorans]EHN10081.1 putative metallo-beta-lactamase family protein [Patulibacter medicamentivorans]
MTNALPMHTPAPGVLRFTIPLPITSPDHLNVHLIDVDGRWVLVDPGPVDRNGLVAATLADADIEPAEVLITHGHVDHWGGATDFATTVLAHAACRQSFELAMDFTAGGSSTVAVSRFGPRQHAGGGAERAFRGFRKLIGGVPSVRDLVDGERLGAWEVLSTPGHEPAHLCLWRASDGVLLCGDLLLPDFTPNVQPAFDGSDALEAFLASLARAGDLRPTLVLPSHGEPYADGHARAGVLRKHHEVRLDRLRDALRDGAVPLAELSGTIFGVRATTAADRMLAEMETWAHLDYLRRRGEVEAGDDEVWKAVVSV